MLTEMGGLTPYKVESLGLELEMETIWPTSEGLPLFQSVSLSYCSTRISVRMAYLFGTSLDGC